MFKMSILWMLIYGGGLLLSFVNPAFGLATYLFEYYLRPALHWWGVPLPDWRWNLMVSVVLGVTYLLHRGKLPSLPDHRSSVLRWLLGLTAVVFLVSVTVAFDTTTSLNQAGHFVKFVIICVLITGVLRTEWALNLFVTVHVLGAAWWGWEAYSAPKRVAGRLMNVGSGDSLGDNASAAHLLIVIPLVAAYALTAKDRRLRWLMLAVSPLIINLFILCNSRGALVGLMVAVLAAMYTARAAHRFRLIAVLGALAVVFAVLADPEFIERQQTTANYEEDGSAQGRLATWSGGLRLVADYPLGAGGKGFHLLSPVYIPDVVAAHDGDLRAPHNTYLLVASEWGIAGLVMYVGMMVASLLALRRVQKRAAESDDDTTYYRSVAIQAGLIGLLVAAAFSDRLYAEAPYWMAALAVSVERLQLKSLELQNVAVGNASALRGATVPMDAQTPGTGFRPGAWARSHR